VSIRDDEALAALRKTSELEGIIPALESAHALAQLHKMGPKLPAGQIVLLSLSGRGDKDVFSLMKHIEV
jgi:tryptophan synthase beta chain